MGLILKYKINDDKKTFMGTYEELKNISDDNAIISEMEYNGYPLYAFEGQKIRRVKEILSPYKHKYKKSIHAVEEVFTVLGDDIYSEIDIRKEFDGDKIRANSHRYQTFHKKGVSCCRCGVRGSFFVKECSGDAGLYHLNLYGFDSLNNIQLMTKDHIIPKSRGGKNELSNYQPMCERCNAKKGNDLENCLICEHHYLKQLFDDDEDVVICKLDNHYIGYMEEASKEMCKSFKPE